MGLVSQSKAHDDSLNNIGLHSKVGFRANAMEF